MDKIVFDINYTNYHDLSENRFIVCERDGEYYYLLDSSDKINDVNNMPNYIKRDYYKYNIRVLTLYFFNNIIEKYRIKYKIIPNQLGNKLETEFLEISEENMKKITSIRRNLKLKEIL